MEFVQIESKSKEDINAILRCEFCGITERHYGKDTDEWFASIPHISCFKCGKRSIENVQDIHSKTVHEKDKGREGINQVEKTKRSL